MAYLPLELGYLTPEMVEKAKNELGETEEVRKESLMELRKLLKEETKLVCPDDDIYLTLFLRARKYNVKRAFNLLLNYYHTKKHRPEVYSHDFLGYMNTLANNAICILPKRDHDGSVIIIIKIENWNYNERKIASAMHDLTITLLFLLEDPATQVCGIKAIFDLKSLSFNHVKVVHPKYLHLMVNGVKNCLPMRLKGVHVINESFLFQHIWNVLKFLLNDKIRNRMHFHASNLEALHKYISPDILPVEYGGKIDYDMRCTLKLADSLRDVYDRLMSCGYKSRRASKEGMLDT